MLASLKQDHLLRPTPLQNLSSMDPFLSLALPLPPSINHQYATVQGRRVLSSAGRRFKNQVGQEMLCILAKRGSAVSLTQTLDGCSFALDLRFYFVSALRRDIDGGLKITQDAVCEALGINDNRIVEVTLRKEMDPATPRMILSLRVVN
jgi:crossover junction endodeoxyribonuclease RusA